ncbi:MAG: amidohydrolase family protein [Acidobacteriia bacterium]|nr:amidohydrolase family protein [Terriglobia bacterium]
MKMKRLLLCASIVLNVLLTTIIHTSAQHSGVTYLKGATVVDLTGRAPFQANVILRDGQIESITTSPTVPPDGHVIDVSGDYVLPGFTDMHAHVTFLRDDSYSSYDRATSEQVLKMLLAYGITTVRNPAAPAVESVRLRDDVANGKILGPRILTAGEALNGKPFSTEAEIRAEVKRQAAVGVNYIKVYANSTPQQTAVAIDEAHKHGLKVIGHLQITDWPTAAGLGIDFVTHGVCWSASALPPQKRYEYEEEVRHLGPMKARIFWLESVDVNGPKMNRIIKSLKQHHISVDPTLIAYKTKFIPMERYRGKQNVSLAPRAMQESWIDGGFTADWTPSDYARMQKAWPKMLEIVALYYHEGVLLTTGSDLPNSWVVPGISLHQEMELLSEAGIPTQDVLAMATRNAAAALGLDREIGTVEVGKRADLVILAANPLDDIRNTRRIKYVVTDGKLFQPGSLLTH